MHRPMIAGWIICLSISGCAWMHRPSPSVQPPASQSVQPPPAPASEVQSSTSGGTDRGSTPDSPPIAAPPPAASSASGGGAKTKPPTGSHGVKQAPQASAAPHLPAAPAPAPSKPAVATLDLKDLEQRLRDTRAIGMFTKLSLKNQVDDLLGEFRVLYQGPSKHPPAGLRQRYDQLLLKVLSLLQDGDPPLAAAIASSREAIWSILADPEKFAQI